VDPPILAAQKRLDYPGKRPVQCGNQINTTPDKEPTE
jgi:hypothetical protein